MRQSHLQGSSLLQLGTKLQNLRNRIISFSEVTTLHLPEVLMIENVIGHNCVWHNQLPDWVANGNFTEPELLSIVENHCGTIVGHFRGQMYVRIVCEHR